MFVKKVVMPVLRDRGSDLAKRWYVEYKYRNPETQKLERIRVFEGINNLKTTEERYKEGQRIVRNLRRRLKNGYNPFENRKFIYQDITAYSKKPGEKYQSGAKEVDYSIEQYLSQTLSSHRANISPRTFQLYQSHIRGFVAWLKENELSEIEIGEFTTAQAQTFLNELKLHGRTRIAYRNNLKRMFNLLKDQKVIEENVWEGTKLPPAATTHAKRAFQMLEQRRIKKYCEAKELYEEWMVIQFIYYCFIRPRELRELKVADINLDQRKILVRAEISKNGKRQHVDIPEAFLPNVLDWIEDKQPKEYVFSGDGGKTHRRRDYFRKKHRKILDALGFDKDVSLYSWKHTGVISFYQATKDLKALQMQLRHHSLEETDHYMHSLGLMENTQVKNNFPAL
ncbi:site-specific integrase [uncultured Microscilla sp.]|uniref:tyrosine-type recombinase/integrase n=1 Tax=uncultured Microscilla sp. TaxID=432653 RepID=UPI002623E35C|nr:site-specific integrase [uncultured Microscilla sp.]